MRRKRLSASDYDRLRLAVLNRDQWSCQRCGMRTNLDVHHTRTRARGGSDELENLIVLCRLCHSEVHLSRGEDPRVRERPKNPCES